MPITFNNFNQTTESTSLVSEQLKLELLLTDELLRNFSTNNTPVTSSTTVNIPSTTSNLTNNTESSVSSFLDQLTTFTSEPITTSTSTFENEKRFETKQKSSGLIGGFSGILDGGGTGCSSSGTATSLRKRLASAPVAAVLNHMLNG
jgi:hypothetical protein